MTLADLDLSVGDHCATLLHDDLAKTVRRTGRLSALRLAEWFAVNWWRLIWEPDANDVSWRMSHQIGGAGGGYLWPDLSFSSDWESITVRSRQTESSKVEPVRYLNDFRVSIPTADFKHGIDDFLNGTIARLADTGNETELSALWREVTRERRDRDLSRRRRLEAGMGYDRAEGPHDLLDRLQHASGTYGEGPVREIAAECRNDAVSQIDSLVEEARERDISVLLPSYGDLRSRIQEATDYSHLPWHRAREAARIARQEWCLKGPVKSANIADLFSIKESTLSDYVTIPIRSVSAGVRDGNAPGKMRIVWNMRSPVGRRFSLARLVADNLMSPPEETLLPATRAKTGRQQFQRAFAQEFLCPYESLREVIGGSSGIDDDAIELAAEHFEVSTWVVVRALVNNGALPHEALDLQTWPPT